MPNQIRSDLTLAADPVILPLARAFVRELAMLAKLPDERTANLIEATDEACAEILRRAAEDGSFSISGAVSPVAIEISYRDRGLPFDPAAAGDGGPAEVREAHALVRSLERLGLDQARWVSLGPAGMELRLTMHRPLADVTQRLPESALRAYQTSVPLAPPQQYSVRRLQPEDAIGVSQAIYRTYGYTYPNPDLYYPDRIVHLNATGELISAVAVAADGEVCGHYALERPGLGPVAESGQAVVAPAHRERGLMQKMRTFLEEQGRATGLLGIFSQPVTVHPYSQRVNESFGSKPIGISLALAPSDLHFKKILDGGKKDRVTCMLYFKHLVAPRPVVIYPPAQHEALLARIYEGIGVDVELRAPRAEQRAVMDEIYERLGAGRRHGENVMDEIFAKLGAGGRPAWPKVGDGPGEVDVQFVKGIGAGFIRVRRIGLDTPAVIRRARRDLCESAGAGTVYLDLPLNQAEAPAACALAEADGFYFCALGRYFGPDAADTLRLQYQPAEVDLSALTIANPFGRELAQYLEAERRRVRRPQ